MYSDLFLGYGKSKERHSKYVSKDLTYLKHNKRILQKRGTTLSGEELVKLRCILSQSDELRRAYILKEAFYKVLRQKTELVAKRELNKWLAMVMGYNLDAFKGIFKIFLKIGRLQLFKQLSSHTPMDSQKAVTT